MHEPQHRMTRCLTGHPQIGRGGASESAQAKGKKNKKAKAAADARVGGAAARAGAATSQAMDWEQGVQREEI